MNGCYLQPRTVRKRGKRLVMKKLRTAATIKIMTLLLLAPAGAHCA
jgi:hypothetical protein